MKKVYLFIAALFSYVSINAQCSTDFEATQPTCSDLDVPVTFNFAGTGNGGVYAWEFGPNANPTTSAVINPGVVTFSVSGAVTVTLTVTGATLGGGGLGVPIPCIASTVVKTVNIVPTPVISFTSTATPCANTEVDFTNTADNTGLDGLNFSWDFGPDATPRTSTAENPKGIKYTKEGSKDVTFNITNANGCTNALTQTITIEPTPEVSFTSTAPMCTDLDVDFTNTGTSVGCTYLWSFGADASLATSTVQNPTSIVSYSVAGVKTVTLTTTNSTSSCAVTQTGTITINQTPTATFNTNPTQCVGEAVNFTNTGSTSSPSDNWAYNWDFGQDASPKTSSSENPFSIKYSSGGNKLVTITVYNNLCTKTDTASISVNDLPVVNAGADTVICANTSVQIGSAAIGGDTYSWFPTSTLDDGIISNPESTPVAGETEYLVKVTTTATGCINYDTIKVTMLPPLITDAGIDVEICRNDSVQLGAGLIQGQIYSWAVSNGLNSTTASNPTTSPDSTTTYILTVTGNFLTTGASCPAETDEVLVTVNQLPNANAGLDDSVTVGESIQLIATGGVQYTWLPFHELDNDGVYNPIAKPNVTTEFRVEVIDLFGCINNDSVLITVLKPTFWTPSAFTPNGDGKSDVFFVRGEGIDDFEFGIISRWGEQLFRTTDMLTGWDGNRPVTNEKLPAGAYVYYIKGVKTDGEVVSEKGIINLIR